MMKQFIAFLALMLVATGAAEAYQGVGSHIRRSTDAPRNLRSNDAASGIRAANNLGRCLAERRGTLARDLLAMPFQSAEQVERAELRVSGIDHCMHDGFMLRTDTLPVLGGMAEYYLLDVFDAGEIAAAATSGATPRNGFEHLGQCVAKRGAAAIVALVDTEPASDDEREAVQALVPHLGPCVLAGETVQFTPMTVRAIAAVGLYQLIAAHNSAGAQITEAVE